MSIGIQLRKVLEDNGYVSKKTKIGSVWTMEHRKYMTVNYHNNGTVSFNYLGKYMRDTVKKSHGTIIGIAPVEKEQLYRKALSRLSFYDTIKDHIHFSLRAGGGDYVLFSGEVGLDVLAEVLHFIVSDCGGSYRPSASP